MTAAAAPIPAGVALERRLLRKLLRLPLVVKLAGANLLIVIGALVAAYIDQRSRGEDYRLLVLLGVALLAGLVVNATLVTIALRPIRALEKTAERFWKGDLAARVPWSAVADRDIEKLSDTLNLLLESNEQERQRVRALTEGVLRHEESERVDVARILHESQAQSLTGLLYCLTAAISECDNEQCKRHLEEARLIAQRGVEELRALSSRVHPSLLDDFGLVAAICQVGRAIERDNAGLKIHVRHDEVRSMQAVSPSDKSVLYRATEEALRSAVAHGATRIGITIRADAAEVSIDLEDNGATAEPGMALAVTTRLWLMRERLAFIGGTCTMRSDPSGGARVTLRLPLSRTGSDIMDVMPTAMTPEPNAA